MRRRSLGLVPILLSFATVVVGDDNACDADNPCVEGCCSSSSNVCGFGPDYCGADFCIEAASTNGTCAQLAECDPGVYPGWGVTWGTSHTFLTCRRQSLTIVRFRILLIRELSIERVLQ